MLYADVTGVYLTDRAKKVCGYSEQDRLSGGVYRGGRDEGQLSVIDDVACSVVTE